MLSLNYVMEIFSNWYLSHVTITTATYRSQHINIISQYQPLSLSKRWSFILSLLPPLTFARTDSPVQLFFGGFSSFPGNYRWCSKREGKAGTAILSVAFSLTYVICLGISIFISQYWSVHDYSLNVRDIAQTECQTPDIFIHLIYKQLQLGLKKN